MRVPWSGVVAVADEDGYLVVRCGMRPDTLDGCRVVPCLQQSRYDDGMEGLDLRSTLFGGCVVAQPLGDDMTVRRGERVVGKGDA